MTIYLCQRALPLKAILLLVGDFGIVAVRILRGPSLILPLSQHL